MMVVMRITIVLLLVGWCLTRTDGPRLAWSRQPQVASAWRHTSGGWEHRGRWATTSISQSRLNPLLVALDEILICVAALAIWSPLCNTRLRTNTNDTGRALDNRRTP